LDPLRPAPPLPTPPPPTERDDLHPGVSRSFSFSQLIGVLFLFSQVIFVLQTHYSPDSPRLLTPVEGLTRYELHATFTQRPLSPTEIQHRYGIPSHSDSPLTVDAIRTVIEHREKPIPIARALLIRLHTREAEGPEDYWLWPQQ
jgi:hypothetical protein